VTTIYLPRSISEIYGTGINPDNYFSTSHQAENSQLFRTTKTRKRFIPIINYDKLCLFRALEVGRVRHDVTRIREAKINPNDPKLFTENKIKNLKKNPERQRLLAIQLIQNVGLSAEEETYGLESIKKVQYKKGLTTLRHY
jgi:hypothetical protein